MKDFKAVWKTIANEKRNTSEETLRYLILKTINSKNPNKEQLLENLIYTSFSEITNWNKLNSCKYSPYKSVKEAINIIHYGLKSGYEFRYKLNLCLETNEEITLYHSLVKFVKDKVNDFKDVKVCYFFIRPELMNIHKVVQAAHVAARMASVYNRRVDDKEFFKNVHFIMLKASHNLNEERFKYYCHKDFVSHSFYETNEFAISHLGLLPEENTTQFLTAIATEPMKKSLVDKKGLFSEYELLTL
jgi:hypothetical protein